MHESSWDWLPVTKLLVLFCLAVLAAPHARAQQIDNLSWRPNATSTRWQGSWQVATPTGLVICSATATANVNSAPIVQFQNCATFVFACDVLQTIGVPDGCPTPGNYSQERFLPRATIAGAPSACPAQPAAESQPQVCPAGTLGQWTQTRVYASVLAPECWRVGEWLPLTPPAGSCPPIPPLAIYSFNAAPSNEVPANGGTVTLSWRADAVDGCRLNDEVVPQNGSRVVVLTSASPEFTDFTLVCKQQADEQTLAVRLHVRQPAVCYPLSDVPPENWNPLTGWRFVWYGSDLLPRGWVASWSCRLPDTTLRNYCVGSRFDELKNDAEQVKNGDKARKDRAWRDASWRPFTPEEQAVCDELQVP